MAVLVNEYKKIQYIIDSLILPFIKNRHPQWRELILAYLKYLDETSLFKALNITDNVDVNTMYLELLDDFLNVYFKDVVDLNKFGLNDDNKQLFIELSKLIHNLKMTKTSFGFFFNSFTDFSIPTAGGDINVNDLTIELFEKPEWWLENNDPTRPFTYIFRINTPELSNLKELIAQVHPAGWLQLFLFEVSFEDFIDGYDCFELDIFWGIHYNGKYTYSGTRTIEGNVIPLKYDGGITYSDDINCAPMPRLFESQPSITWDMTSDFPSPPADIMSFKDFDDQGGSYNGVFADASNVYVGCDFSSGIRLYSYDINGNLTYLDNDNTGGGTQDDVFKDATFIIAESGVGGAKSYSVSGPTITFVDDDNPGGGEYRGVWGDGNYLYFNWVSTPNSEIRTYSIDGAGVLTLEQSLVVPFYAQAIWGDGTYIYAVGGPGFGLRSYSVDGLGNLTEVDNIDITNLAGYLGVFGDGAGHIFVGGSTDGLRSYSVDGSGNLSFNSVDTLFSSYWGVWHNGNYLFAAVEFQGIARYSVDISGNLTFIDSDFKGASRYRNVYGDNDHIFIACESDGLRSYKLDTISGSVATWGERGVDDYSGVTEDTSLFNNAVTNNYGAAPSISAYDDTFGVVKANGLIKFDISSLSGLISASSDIVSAELFLKGLSVFLPHTIDAHRVLRDWGEGNKNGSAAGIGESSWNDAKATIDAWGTPGCENITTDRLAAISDSQAITDLSWYVWDVTNDVKAFFDGANNYGWVLRQLVGGSFTIATFEASDSPTLINRPYLKIIYN